MGAVLTRLLEVFYTKKLDIVVIGLENRCVTFLLGPPVLRYLCAASLSETSGNVRPENFRHIQDDDVFG